MNRLIPFCLLLLWAGFAGAQSKPPAPKGACPDGDPWALAPKGRQHIVQNEQKPVRARICYCEGGKKGDFVDVVTVDDSYPGKPDPKGVKSDKGGPIKSKGSTSTALALGSCGDYAGQNIYLYNRNDFEVSGTYLIRTPPPK